MNVIIVGCGNIGFEVAGLLAKGNSVLLVDCCQHDYLSSLLDGEDSVGFAQCDATDVSAISHVFDQFCAKSGGIDALICTVGSPAETSSIENLDAFKNVFDLNFFGNLIPIKAAAERMISAGSGKIVVLSSTSGLFTYLALSAYPPSKWALTNLCRSLRSELSGSGVSVDTIFPRTMRNKHSKKFLYDQGIDPAIVARKIAGLLERPRNSNHIVPRRYGILYKVERLFPGLLDWKAGLGIRMRRMKKFRSRPIESVFITGASSGSGRDMAMLYSKTAKDLYLIARNHESLLQTKADIQKTSKCAVHVISLDITDTQAIKSTVDQIESIDLLINNAGSSVVGQVTDVSVDLYRKSIATNFFGAVQLTSEFLKKDKKPLTIVNVLSTTAIAGRREHSCYSASKAALWAHTRSLRRLFGSEIQIVEVLPSSFSSNFDKNVVRINTGSNSGSDEDHLETRKTLTVQSLTSMDVAKATFKAVEGGKEIVFVPFKSKLFMILEACCPSLFRRLFG